METPDRQAAPSAAHHCELETCSGPNPDGSCALGLDRCSRTSSGASPRRKSTLELVPEPRCSLAECQGKRYARGWCRGHYSRWLRWGDPLSHGSRPTYGAKVRKSADGYIMVHRPGHPLAQQNNYVYQHWLVLYEAGLYDDPKLQVHHVNGDKPDNRLENLQVVSASHHRIIHTSGISDARVAELLREGRKTREIIALGVGAQRIVRVRREMAS